MSTEPQETATTNTGAEVVDIKSKGPSKQEIRAQQRYAERMRRWMNEHRVAFTKAFQEANPTAGEGQLEQTLQATAHNALQREDHEALSPQKRFQILERTIASLHQRLGQLEETAYANDSSLAVQMEVSLKTQARILETLGVPQEAQEKIFEIVKAETEKKMQDQESAREIANRAAQEAVAAGAKPPVSEEENIRSTLAKEDRGLKVVGSGEDGGSDIPEGAQIFGE